ncbi:MAG: hypothetical protein A4S09_03955 [Proteobacteria bacterium SG_bin7]|nr:MAG: hypothetical protein A4S09_03955 [Proteobacteria bacterium SG_bin7]
MKIVVALIVFLPLVSPAQFAVPKVDPCADSYWSKESNTRDTRGDFCLAELAARTVNQILNIMVKGQALETSADSFEMKGVDKKSETQTEPTFISRNKTIKELNDSINIEGTKFPLKPEKVVEMMGQVMLEENARGIKTKFGTFHEWGDDILKYKSRYGAFGWVSVSKIFTCLSMGVCVRFIPTLQEQSLEAWMNSQEDEGITLESLFRQSFILNDGDVYKTILTISNTLSYHWRDKNRANLPWIKKLSPITNRWQNRGDTLGSWYHFFGMILFGYYAGEVPAKAVASIESWMSIFAEGDVEAQEDMLNQAGAVVGARLAKLTVVWKFIGWKNNPESKQKQTYLDLEEDFRDRIHYEIDPNYSVTSVTPRNVFNERPTLTVYKITIQPKNATVPHTNCTIELIPKFFGQNRFFAENKNQVVTSLDPINGTEVRFTSLKSIDDLRVFIQCY